jgi:serine acetyltransferase/thymidylate kinase
MRSPHLLAVELCRFLDEEHVCYSLMGDASVPSQLGPSRVELVIARQAVLDVPLLLHKFCQRSEGKLVTCVRHQRSGWRALLSWVSRDERPEFVSIELFCDFVRSGRTVLTADQVLKSRVIESSSEAAQVRLRPSYYVAAPAIEFVYYLVRCAYEAKLTDEQGQHLRDCWQRNPTGTAAQVRRFWDADREGGVIARAVEANSWDAVREILPLLKSAVRRRAGLNASECVYAVRAWLKAQVQPQGLLLACLGPEGVGKASVIAALKNRPLTPFVDVHTMDLRPRILRPDPRVRAKTPRGRLGTIAKLLMFAVDYWLGFYVQIRPRLVSGMLVVSNRYYDDVFVDPLRYRLAGAFTFARALLPWIPRPDLWLVLDAPAEVIASRSGALPAEESSRQRSEYRRLLRGYENVVVLDARQELSPLAAEAERAIAAHLENRTAERLHLPLSTPKNPRATNLLLFFCRRHVPLLSRLIRILYNSDITCRLPAHIYMPHPYGIVIHSQAAIGERVTIMQQVAVGDKDQRESVAPVIGNDVYIGAGARVLGDVRIGDGVTIGANAIVTQDVPPGVTVVGANRIINAPAVARPASPFSGTQNKTESAVRGPQSVA